MSRVTEIVLEIAVGAVVGLYTGNAINGKVNRLAQAVERGDAALERAYPERHVQPSRYVSSHIRIIEKPAPDPEPCISWFFPRPHSCGEVVSE